MTSINIWNDKVRVKLTPDALEFLEHTEGLEIWPKEDENGWSEWSMYDLMGLFGEDMRANYWSPFCNDEIVIKDNTEVTLV